MTPRERTNHLANDTARAIVKAVEAQTGAELDLNLCFAIVGIVCEAIESQVSPLRAALEAVEWVARGPRVSHRVCPWCFAFMHLPHKPDCQRQLALGDTPAEEQESAA